MPDSPLFAFRGEGVVKVPISLLVTVLLVMVPEHFSEEEVPECPGFPSHENMTMFPSQDVDLCCSTLYTENQDLKRDPLRIGLNSDFFKDIGNILLNLLYGDG